MNEYAREGKKFLKSIDDYFSEFKEVAGGDWGLFFWGRNPLSADKWPNPTQIIRSMNMFSFPEDYRLPLIKCGMGGFDGFFMIGSPFGMFFDEDLFVNVSEMGAWQVSLLFVMATHVMPRFQHALYLRWIPLFDETDLNKLRISDCRKSSLVLGDNYHFIPEDIPVEPFVKTIKEGRTYQTVFYVWSDFGGYLKVTSNIDLPKLCDMAKVKDIKISVESEVIIPYSCGIMF